jgi:hypothetical protein
MQTFTMMTPEEMQVARERLTAHLEGMDADEKTLAVEGLRYLRGANRLLLATDHEENQMTDNLTTREQPDRSKINMNQIHEVRYWTKHFNVSKEELLKAIEKVGNSAAAIRKELAVD